MSRLITRMENASARVASRITNELVNGTAMASAAMAAMTLAILSRLVIARSLPSEQAGRLDREDQRHRGVQGEIRHLGKQRLAEIVGEPDQQRADRGAAQAAHAADDHHREGERQDLEVEPRIDAEKAAADHAADRRERRAEREDEHGN